MKFESWDRAAGLTALAVYDSKIARKINKYLKNYYESLTDTDEPVFIMPNRVFMVIEKLYLRGSK